LDRAFKKKQRNFYLKKNLISLTVIEK
jgi:hypothetical protein